MRDETNTVAIPEDGVPPEKWLRMGPLAVAALRAEVQQLRAELEAARAVVEAADRVRMTAQCGSQPGSVTVPRSAMRELDRAFRAHIDAAKAGKAVE